MMFAELTHFLGTHVSELLAIPSLANVEVRRSVETGLPASEIWYEFDDLGIEIICDDGDHVQAIFLHRGGGEALSGVDFSMSRREVLDELGAPSESGPVSQIPSLGKKGAWDRFAVEGGAIHFQYRLDRDEIEMITLISQHRLGALRITG